MVLTAKDIEPIKEMVREALLKEWKAQGHDMGGKIVEDLEYLIEQDFGLISIIGQMYPYGVYLESGVKASNIPFSPGSGRGKSRYIEGLISYVKKRMNVNDLKTAKSIAFAIAHTHKKEGMPSRGSYKYSSTGKRTGWINDALEKNKNQIGEYIRQFYGNYLRIEFENVVTKNIMVI